MSDPNFCGMAGLPDFGSVRDETPIASEPNTVPGQMALKAIRTLRIAIKAALRRFELGATPDFSLELLRVALTDTTDVEEAILSEHGGEQGASQVSPKSTEDLSCIRHDKINCSECFGGFNPSPSPAAEELLKDRERLIGVVKLAYLKHHCGKDNIGWEALSERMCDELCNAMGDKEFQLWLSEENQDV